MVLDPRTGRYDGEATEALRREERRRRLRRGLPWERFLQEWGKLQPPEEMLRCYGTWPDARPNRPIIRI